VAIGELDDAVFSADASRHDQVSIEANLYLGTLYANRVHNTQMAKNASRHAEAVLARFRDHPILAAWLGDVRADISLDEGHLEEALLESQKVLALKESALGASDFDVAVSASNVAVKLHALNRDLEAEPLIVRAVNLFTKLSGGDSTVVAVTLVNHAETLTGLGRFAEAHAALDRALATFRSQHASPFYIGYALLDLGILELAEQHVAAAVEALERSVALLGDQDSLIAAQAGFNLARALWIASPREHQRSAALVRDTRQALAGKPGATRLVRDIDAWRTTHRLPG